jgi:hypothetical protein
MGWLNCTPTSFAMAMEKATLGRVRVTGCDVRRQTGDLSGGTTLWQCRTAAEHWGVKCDVRAGGNVIAPTGLAVRVSNGQGAVVQGNTSALLATKFRSTGTGVNHAVYLNEVRGGSSTSPREGLVYDPAADGRVAGWGTAAKGPQWWPWATVLNFCAALKPGGDGTSARLGPGKVYAAIFADTEPHVHLYSGAVRTSPFPDKQIVNHRAPTGESAMRLGPSTAYKVAMMVPNGTPFTAYQYKPNGGTDNGTTGWFGNHDGNRWIHESDLIGRGGTS